MWGNRQEKVSEEVKCLLQSPGVLVQFYDRPPLILSCDASPYRVGAVLSHRMANGEEGPICFACGTLMAAEQQYSLLDKEDLAIAWCEQASPIPVCVEDDLS